VSTVRGEFTEASAHPRTRSVPLSHVSIELGHLYLEDFAAGPDRLRTLFTEARPWVEATLASVRTGGARPRISTCFLVDDYFSDLGRPGDLVPQILEAATAAGVKVDYLARESACASMPGEAGPVSAAQLLIGRLVAEPVSGTNGARPPAARSGWLCNGQRSPSSAGTDAMDLPRPWSPPEQAAARRHSIFVDVQLWDGEGEQRVFSCALLAAAWQLLRLGLVRSGGRPLAEPVDADGTWPDTWAQLPAVTRLDPRAAPFFAYTSTSLLSARFLPVELAVRTILGQVWHDPEVLDQISARAGAEGVVLAEEVLDRIGYVFAGSGRIDPT
jgi:hypothetical protein